MKRKKYNLVVRIVQFVLGSILLLSTASKYPTTDITYFLFFMLGAGLVIWSVIK